MELQIVRLYHVPGAGQKYAPAQDAEERRQMRVGMKNPISARFTSIADFGSRNMLSDELVPKEPSQGRHGHAIRFAFDFGLIGIANGCEEPRIWMPAIPQSAITAVFQEPGRLAMLYSLMAPTIHDFVERQKRYIQVGESLLHPMIIPFRATGAFFESIRTTAAFAHFGLKVPPSKNGKARFTFADEITYAASNGSKNVVLVVAADGMADAEISGIVQKEMGRIMGQHDAARQEHLKGVKELTEPPVTDDPVSRAAKIILYPKKKIEP